MHECFPKHLRQRDRRRQCSSGSSLLIGTPMCPHYWCACPCIYRSFSLLFFLPNLLLQRNAHLHGLFCFLSEQHYFLQRILPGHPKPLPHILQHCALSDKMCNCFRWTKTASSILYDCRKCATHLRTSVLTNTCAWEQQDWNKTKKHKKANRKEWKWKEVQRAQKKESRRPNGSSGISSPRDRYSQKQWINYITNKTRTCTASTSPWGVVKSESTQITNVSNLCLQWQSIVHC